MELKLSKETGGGEKTNKKTKDCSFGAIWDSVSAVNSEKTQNGVSSLGCLFHGSGGEEKECYQFQGAQQTQILAWEPVKNSLSLRKISTKTLYIQQRND